MANALKPRKRLGLWCRREVLWPTRRGWLVLVASILLLLVIVVRTIQPFLAVTKPGGDGLLVVEGWLADYALKAAVEEFRGGRFEKLYLAGGPLEQGGPLSEYKTYAELGAAVVVGLGLPTNAVTAVPGPDVRQDRTYASAAALRDWLQGQGKEVSSLTVVSVGAHARRTRLLYEKAFGDGVKIGIIAVPDREYDASRWWASSAGVRDVIDETVAYLYARLIFRPPKR